MSDAVMVSESVQLPQGLKDIKDLLVKIVSDLHNKVPVAQMVAGDLLLLEKAIADAGELAADIKSAQMPVFAGLLAGQVAGALLALAPAAPVA